MADRLYGDQDRIAIARESPDQPDVRELLRLSDEYNLARYPRESCHGLCLSDLLARKVRFYVAREEGRALGCGGYDPYAQGIGELKRMFVLESERGKGIGRRMLQQIECEARQEGMDLMQLETGVASEGALALYERAGYRRRGPFGPYKDDPLIVFMEKRLA